MPVTTTTLRPREEPRRESSARSITFRLTVEMHAALADIADTERRSLNGVVGLLLEEALEARAIAKAAHDAEMAELRRAAKAAKAAGLIESKPAPRKRKPKAAAPAAAVA